MRDINYVPPEKLPKQRLNMSGGTLKELRKVEKRNKDMPITSFKIRRNGEIVADFVFIKRFKREDNLR